MAENVAAPADSVNPILIRILEIILATVFPTCVRTIPSPTVWVWLAVEPAGKEGGVTAFLGDWRGQVPPSSVKFLQPLKKTEPPFFLFRPGREQKTARKDKNRHLVHTPHRVGGKTRTPDRPA